MCHTTKNMKLISAKITSRGLWNTRVFNPLWFKTFLFENEEIQVLVNFNTGEFGYKCKDLFLEPRPNFFDIKIEKFDEKTVKFATLTLIKMLEMFSNTPKGNLSFNVEYEVNTEEFTKLTSSNSDHYPEEMDLTELVFRKKEGDKEVVKLAISGVKEGILIFSYTYNFEIKNVNENCFWDNILHSGENLNQWLSL